MPEGHPYEHQADAGRGRRGPTQNIQPEALACARCILQTLQDEAFASALNRAWGNDKTTRLSTGYAPGKQVTTITAGVPQDVIPSSAPLTLSAMEMEVTKLRGDLVEANKAVQAAEGRHKYLEKRIEVSDRLERLRRGCAANSEPLMFVRVHPKIHRTIPLDKARDKARDHYWKIDGPGTISYGGERVVFHGVCPPNAPDDQFNSYIDPTVIHIFTFGGDLAIIADGYSGSGKSHTMLSQPAGLALHIAKLLEKHVQDANACGWRSISRCSFVEFTGDRILDLLTTKPDTVKTCSVSLNTHLTSTSVKFDDANQYGNYLLGATSRRSTARSTNNKNSSRSNLVCSIDVEMTHTGRGLSRRFKVRLTDLAGQEPPVPSLEESEKTSQERARISERQKEAGKLNKDRLAFDRAMGSWNSLKTVNFQQSKLAAVIRRDFTTIVPLVRVYTINFSDGQEQASKRTLEAASKFQREMTAGMAFR